MKKWFVLCLCLMLCLCSVTAAAADVDTPSESMAESDEIQVLSQPKVMVSGYTVSPETLKPGKDSKITVTLKNTHKTADAVNIKLTFASNDGAVLSSSTDSAYLEKLEHGKTYDWTFSVTAASFAESGKHTASISAEYETATGVSFVSSDNITLTVDNPPVSETTPTPQSQPRLMVTEYEIENDSISPDGNTTVKITITNTNKNRSVRNIKLSLSDGSGEIKADGMGTGYLDRISAGGSYTWEVAMTATHTASVGEHSVTIYIEYEDTEGMSYSASDELRIPVRQPVRLDFDGASLPAKMIQGDTATVSLNLMNTGKGTLYNCKFVLEGEHFVVGGTTFVGEILPGDSKNGSANVRVDDFLGQVEGKIIISYEDDFGKTYEESVDISSLVEERVERKDEPEEKEKKNTLWWLFMLLGLLVGGGAGFGIPFAIKARKDRLEDEKRL